MNHMEDKKISEALLEGTAEVVKLKDMVWNNIQRELNLDVPKKAENMKTNNKKDRKGLASFIKYGSIAAAIAIIVGANTQYGQAAVGKIKELFVPNKVVKQEIEGMPSESNVTLKESKMKYIIYIDEERYAMENLVDRDRIVTKNKPSGVPEVFIEIQQVEGKKPENAAEEIEKELKAKYKNVEVEGKVNEPVNGIAISANSGNRWNDTVLQYYVVDNTKGGSFIIKEQYFMEASEGHGARFYNMLKEFKVVSE